jgi:hypothetical protein
MALRILRFRPPLIPLFPINSRVRGAVQGPCMYLEDGFANHSNFLNMYMYKNDCTILWIKTM